MPQVYQIHSQVQLFPILLINLIGTLGFSIVLPFLVFSQEFWRQCNSFWYFVCNISCISAHRSTNLRMRSDSYRRKKILLLSNAGTLIGWIFFLVALFLPKENILRVNSPLLGTFVISLPLVVIFFLLG
jgi:MFS transporter, DHA1 family, tetracycline resistance protein